MRYRFFASMLAVGCTAGVAANAAVISTDTAVYSGLGSSLRVNPFDQVTLGASTGTVTTFPGQFTLNAVTFLPGPTGITSGSFTGSLADTGTINGAGFSYTIPYTLTVAAYLDTVVLGATSFAANGFQFTTDALTLSGNAAVTGNLRATIALATPATVPEPATFALLGVGLAGLCMVRRRRMRIA